MWVEASFVRHHSSYWLFLRHRKITDPPINILLADDDVEFCQAIRDWASREPELNIVGEAHDGREAVTLARELEPNVILMDVGMPVLNGIEATREIVSYDPVVRVIAHSLHSHKRIRAEMIRAGASAYVLKENAFDELLGVIRSVTSSDDI